MCGNSRVILLYTIGIDSSVSILGHELAEIITDPLLSSWNDAYGQEVAGKAVSYLKMQVCECSIASNYALHFNSN